MSHFYLYFRVFRVCRLALMLYKLCLSVNKGPLIIVLPSHDCYIRYAFTKLREYSSKIDFVREQR